MSTVSIIDDDADVLDAVALLLRARGYDVATYSNATDFLRAEFQPGCIVSDVRMPDITGLDLLARLKDAGDPRPVVLLTGHGDVGMAMLAVKQGAFDFIEKPFKDSFLLQAVEQAIETGREIYREQAELAALKTRYGTLTQRQRETMQLVVEGLSNKDIAARLGISPRTVEIYRAWLMTKMGANSVADLVKMAIRLDTG